MSQYDGISASARKLISSKGVTLEFRRFDRVHDPVTGETTTGSVARQSLPSVVLPVGKNDNIPEGLVISKSRKLIVAGSDALFQLSVLDVTKFNGDYWQVKGLEPLQPDAGSAIIFTAFVERVGLTEIDGLEFSGPDGAEVTWDSPVWLSW